MAAAKKKSRNARAKPAPPRGASQRSAPGRPVKQDAPAADSTRLQGQVAVVTGASRGIGLAIAEALAAAGCKVVITGRDKAALGRATKQVAELGVVRAFETEITDEISVAGLFDEVRRRFGRIDILINNAGIVQPMKSVRELTSGMWRSVIDTNLTGLFLCAKYALPLMPRGSTMVNNLSISADQIFPNSASYTASKYGALGLTRVLREELKSEGIRVIALLPGAVATGLWNVLWPEAPRDKMMSPESIAQAVLAALRLPSNATVEEIRIATTAGAL